MENSSTNNICVICGRLASEKHHIKTVGSGGTDDEWNLLPICRYDHARIHAIGLKKVVEKCPGLEAWLVAQGWELDPYKKKWRHNTVAEPS